MKVELRSLINQIIELKTQIGELRPIPTDMEKRIMQKFRLDWNFHSNNLEGNQLTFGETKTFLLHGITAEGKPLKDHLDIKGHNEAILLLEDAIKEDRKISENFIRELHEIILKEPYNKKVLTPDGKVISKKIEIGKYKSQPNHVKTITGEMFYFASPEETPAKMYDLINWYKKTNTDINIHPLLTASLFHYKFIRIHPFDDGNGRIARIIMNLILMQNGFPPVVIKTNEKQKYLNALQQADGGDTEAFIIYIGNELIKSMNLFFRGAKGLDIEDEDDIDKQIDIFKKELNGLDNVIIQSVEINKKILSNIFKPLLKKVLSKLKEFDELFSNVEILCWVNGKSSKVEDDQQLLNSFAKSFLEQKQIINKTGIEYNFLHFKKKTKNYFNVMFSIEFDFKLFDSVLIRAIDQEILKISYSNPTIETRQIKKIANEIAKKALELIKNEVNSVES